MYPSLPTEGLFGCFQVWAIINKAAVNICVRAFCVDISFQIFWVNSRATCSSYSRVFIFFRRFQTVFSRWLYHFAMNENEFPSAVYATFCWSTSESVFGVANGQDFSHSTRCTLMFHCCFNVHFSDHIDVDHLFLCFFAISESSLNRCLSEVFAHF